MSHPLAQFFAEFFVLVRVAFFQRHETAHGLPGDFVRLADDSSFGDKRMTDQRRFHFHGAEAMAADVHHVVDAAQDPIIAIVIATGGVAGEIGSRHACPVLFLEAIGVAPNVANHAGPGAPQNQKAFAARFDGIAVEIDDIGNYAGHGKCSGARFQRHGSRHGSDQHAAGFGLPPGINNGTTAFADHAVIPFPRGGIDGLAYRTKQA